MHQAVTVGMIVWPLVVVVGVLAVMGGILVIISYLASEEDH